MNLFTFSAVTILLCLFSEFSLCSNILQPTTITALTEDDEIEDVDKGIVLHKSKENDSVEEIVDDEEFEDSCDGRIGSFVRHFNSTPFLPEDYEQVKESMSNTDIFDQVHHINDSVQILERLAGYVNQIRFNSDILDSINYLSSIISEKILDIDLSTECVTDIFYVIKAIRQKHLWAYYCEFPFDCQLAFQLVHFSSRLVCEHCPIWHIKGTR